MRCVIHRRGKGMTDTIRFDEDYLEEIARSIRKLSNSLQDASNDMSRLNVDDTGAGGLGTSFRCRLGSVGAVASGGNMSAAFRQSAICLSRLSDYAERLSKNVQIVSSRFVATENDLLRSMGVEAEEGGRSHGGGGRSFADSFKNAQHNVGQAISGGLIKPSGLIQIFGGELSNQFFSPSNLFETALSAAVDLKNYLRIGRAIGQNNAIAGWAKNLIGLKNTGGSKAGNVFMRFKNNLTIQSCDYSLRNVLKDYTGANGAGKAVAKWGGVLLDGVMNFFSNKEEQVASNGEMSDGRVLAETVTETGVNMAISIGAKVIIGSAITAIAGTAGAPAILVAGATAVTVAGINAVTKWLTGETATEHISDFLVDTGEKVVDGVKNMASAIGDGAKKAANAIGNWFGKLRFA